MFAVLFRGGASVRAAEDRPEQQHSAAHNEQIVAVVMTVMPPRRRRRRRTVPVRRRRRGRPETWTAGTRRRRRRAETGAAGARRRRRRAETGAAGARRRRRRAETGAAGAAARNSGLRDGDFLRGSACCSRPAQDGGSRSDNNDANQSLPIHEKTSLSAISQCPQDTGELDFGKYQSPLLAAAPSSTPRRSMAPPTFSAS